MVSIDHPAACRPGAQQRLALIGPKYEDNQINLLLIKNSLHFPRPSSSSATILEILS